MPTSARILTSRTFLWLFALGCFLAGSASGRFSLRLILDGAIALAFVPAITLGACAIVLTRTRRRGLSVAEALGLFLDGNGPWLMWLVVGSTVASIVPPRQVGPWLGPVVLSMLVPLVWSLVNDLRFFGMLSEGHSAIAWRQLIAHRCLSWIGMTVYFFGIAIWGETIPEVVRWLTS